MRYCTRCKRLYIEPAHESCPFCGKATIEEPNHQSPVYLLTANGFELERVRSALEENDIAYRCNQSPSDTGLQILNAAPAENCDIYVALGDYRRTAELLTGIGAFKEEPPQPDEKAIRQLEEAEKKTREEYLPPKKARLIRILSAIGFLILLVLVVYATDFVIALVKNAFGLT